jgi:hypothetical protein
LSTPITPLPESAGVQEAPSLVPPEDGQSNVHYPRFSSKILNVGFVSAIFISAACFVFSAIYLHEYLSITSGAVDTIIRSTAGQPAAMQLALAARLAVAKYSLSSCGVVSGLAFGFLGFALFLLGIEGTMDAGGSNKLGSIQLARVAPGTFVLTCAAILIGISVTHRIDFDATEQYQAPTVQPAATYSVPEVGHDQIP